MKDLLFYSNYCTYSQEVLNTINKLNIRASIMCVCVDNCKFKIPSNITRVPALLTSKKQLLLESSIYEYLASIGQQKASAAAPQAPHEVLAAMASSTNDFVFLTEDGYDNEGVMLDAKQNFSMLTQNQAIAPVLDKAEHANKGKSKFDDTVYERFLASRTSDDEVIKRQMDHLKNPGAAK